MLTVLAYVNLTRPEGLPDELHPVQRPYRRQNVRGIGPLPSTGTQQPQLRAAIQRQVEDPGLDPVLDQPAPKLAEHREVESRVGQLQGQGNAARVTATVASGI
ncbi:hypothetical protein KLK06_17405 [Nonomuraea sp. NEAU-A123]|nr:hypothetical protein [Nonomuraea sp. NEAU-A123]